MKVNVKRLHPEAVVPSYNIDGDAGIDLTATTRTEQREYIEYGTGLAIKIPEGHAGLLFPRSSISKMALTLANSVGVIDSNYRGEVKLRFKDAMLGRTYNIGDRIGQLLILPYPKIELTEVEELSNTDRGNGGFGSTGD